MRECPKCMSWWGGDTCPICEAPLMSEYSNNDGSDGVFAEPVPEPKPKFANIKVGDWVEGESENRGIVHREVSGVSSDTFAIGTKCDGYVYWYDFNGNCVTMLKGFKPIRTLSPKEVVVDFGSGIKGTVRKSPEFNWIFIHDTSGKLVAWIDLRILDPKTKDIVESILKAQEEACHN